MGRFGGAMRTGVRGIVALVVAASLLLAAGGAAGATAWPVYRGPGVGGFFSTPYSNTLLYFEDVYSQTLPPGFKSVWIASYSEWQTSGFPTPRPAPTRYLRAPWSPTVFAVHEFVGNYGAGLLVHALTFSEWETAGYPSQTVTPNIPSAVYTGFSASPEIDVNIAGETHALTISEWLASGSPAPKTTGWKPGASLVQYITSAPDIFAVAPDWSAHRLTYAEWSAWGFPAFRSTQLEGYYTLAWAPIGIAYVDEAQNAYLLSYAEWVEADHPTPESVPSLPPDQACRDTTQIVHYDGVTWSGTMTDAEAAARLDFAVPAC